MTNEHNTENEQSTELVEVEASIENTQNGASAPLTPAERILAPLELADYSQFLYDTNFGGKKGQDFTAEGVKTLGLNNGISTSDVRVDFINDDKTEALFYCTATDRNGDTSDVVVKQCEKENGRINPNWIEKGCSRAIRNAIKARLPVQLFKMALSKAIAAGEVKQSAIVEAQRALSVAWEERSETILDVSKRTFFDAAQKVYGDSNEWDASTWQQITEDLNDIPEWVKNVATKQNGPF